MLRIVSERSRRITVATDDNILVTMWLSCAFRYPSKARFCLFCLHRDIIWDCQYLPHRTFCLRVYAASGRSWDHAILSDSPACKQMVTQGVRCNHRFSPREYPTIMSLATFASGSWGGSTVVPVITSVFPEIRQVWLYCARRVRHSRMQRLDYQKGNV
jgi:hypothetical protein